jgi:RNA polymerase sigma factor (sigma-70 family)
LKDEAQFIAALRAGQEAAFRNLVAEYQQRVLNTCLSYVPDLQEAENLTQEVFVEVFLSIQHFRGEAGLSTWIYRIACNKGLALLRHRNAGKRRNFFQRLLSLDFAEQYPAQDAFHHPGFALEQQESAALLFRQLDKLPENQRSALMLHKVEGLSYQEIAEVLQTTLPAVESLIHRAKGNLRKHLHQHFDQFYQG